MKSWKNKLLFTVSAFLISPIARAHDSSYSFNVLEHIWAHVIEVSTTNAGLLLTVVILASLFISALLVRTRLKATTETHA